MAPTATQTTAPLGSAKYDAGHPTPQHDTEPTYRRHAPKLPPGATFTPTHLVERDETTGKWMNRRKVAFNRDRQDKKALKLTGRQLKKLRRESKAREREAYAAKAALIAAESQAARPEATA